MTYLFKELLFLLRNNFTHDSGSKLRKNKLCF